MKKFDYYLKKSKIVIIEVYRHYYHIISYAYMLNLSDYHQTVFLIRTVLQTIPLNST